MKFCRDHLGNQLIVPVSAIFGAAALAYVLLPDTSHDAASASIALVEPILDTEMSVGFCMLGRLVGEDIAEMRLREEGIANEYPIHPLERNRLARDKCISQMRP